MEGDEMLSNREFRKIYRKIMEDTKRQVNIRQAYTILNCCGRNVTSAHLNKQWQYLSEKISVDRLYDIYTKAEEVVLSGQDYDKAVRTKTLRAADVMKGVKEGSLVNRQYLEHILEEFSTPEGFINIGDLLDAASQSRVEVFDKLMGPSVEENVVEYTCKVRGWLTVNPKVQCVCYTFEAEQPAFCELILSLVENSDVPKDRFSNDVFLVIFNNENQLVGLTRHVVEKNYKFSTGMMTLNPGDVILVLAIGTTMDRKSSAIEKAVLIEENHKLSRRFRTTLMNLFESFDVDQDGLLNHDELNLYTMAGGDTALTDVEWEVYKDSFETRDGKLTMTGFIKAHETESVDLEGNAVSDLWHSLHSLGYNSQLISMFGCAYEIEARTSRKASLVPYFLTVAKLHRQVMLENLFHMGEEDDRFEIRLRMFRTEYFGLLIAIREEKYARETYQLTIEPKRDIKINYPHKVDELIRLADSDSDWVLMASFTMTDPNAEFEYTLQKVNIKSTSPSLARSQT